MCLRDLRKRDYSYTNEEKWVSHILFRKRGLIAYAGKGAIRHALAIIMGSLSPPHTHTSARTFLNTCTFTFYPESWYDKS